MSTIVPLYDQVACILADKNIAVLVIQIVPLDQYSLPAAERRHAGNRLIVRCQIRVWRYPKAHTAVVGDHSPAGRKNEISWRSEWLNLSVVSNLERRTVGNVLENARNIFEAH